MKKKLAIVATICMTMFSVGCTKYDYTKKYEDTAIVKETYTKLVKSGTVIRTRYYTTLMYKGDAYTISGREYYEYAENKIEDRININVEDKILENEVIQRAVSIDEYCMND